MVFLKNTEPEAYIQAHNLKIVEDAGLLEQAVLEAVEENPGPFAELKGGKEKVYGFFVGKVMQKMQGKANPAKVREMLEKKVAEEK